MKASYRWLRSLVPALPDDPQKVAARFTAAGLEVEGSHVYGAGIETCVCAWVVSVRQHPTKSGLRLVTVDRGGATQEVVCGAPNVPDPGGVVVLAPLGTHLPAKNMTIERRAIGGVESEGMLCSEAELGLTEESGGILVLPPAFAQPGTRFVDAVPNAQDTIFEIGLTPNRPDGLGHLGLAREAAALFGIPWKMPEPETPSREAGAKVADVVKVRIDDAERCPHYAAGIVEGTTVAPSPLDVRYRLAALGVRPISNIVDVTNLVMLEYGHPMHAFDAGKIAGGTIIVRRAAEGEKLVTLDGEARVLTADDLVIADANGPVALAGVMGGASTEIGPSTRRILLECAYFDPRTVRRTARRHGLHSESSHRFERGVDHGDTRAALRQATAMACRLGGGAAAPEPLYTQGKALEQAVVSLRASHMDALIGAPVPLGEAIGILERLGFARKSAAPDTETFVVPTHRPDVTREADLIDEVVRVRGMDSVPTVLPAIRPTMPVGGREELVRRVRAAAVELGLLEAIPYSFTSAESLAAAGAPPAAVVLKNPLSSQQGVMRTSVLPGLLDVARLARNRGEPNVALFTIGTVFLPPLPGERLPIETHRFAALLAGDRPAYLRRPEAIDVWDAKGLAEGLMRRLGYADVELRALQVTALPRHLHPRGAGEIVAQGAPFGVLGPLHPDVADAWDLDRAVVVELDLAAVSTHAPPTPRYAPLPRHPASTRDLAVVVKDEVAAGDVVAAAAKAAGDLAEAVRLFDRFTGEGIPAGSVSLALRIVYRAGGRTLTDAEVDARHAAVVEAVSKAFGATLRA